MLVHGDSRAAVAMSVSPFLVACYCDDLDGVCVLRFPDAQAEAHGIRRGDRLLTVLNSVCVAPGNRGVPVPDLVQGSHANLCYENFRPLVAELLSDDVA